MTPSPTSPPPQLSRRDSEVRGFLSRRSSDEASTLQSQQSFFQDERSGWDLEVAKAVAQGEPTVNLEYSMENGLQPLEVVYQEPRQKWCSRRRAIMVGVCLTLFVIVLGLAVGLVQKEEDGTRTSSFESAENNGGSNSGGGSSNDNSGGDNSGSTAASNPASSKQGPFYQTDLPPLSTLDPVTEMNLYAYERNADSSPSTRLGTLNRRALPTNAWYQSILRLGEDEEPTNNHKAHLVPYVVDMAGSIPGVRMHGTRLEAAPTQVTLTIDEPYALVMGAAEEGVAGTSGLAKGYTALQATELGITLQWDAYSMKSSLVRGSPYITMVYNDDSKNQKDAEANSDSAVAQSRQAATVLPTLFSEVGLSDIVVDGKAIDVDQHCGSGRTLIEVQNELDLSFYVGQRWLVFVSQPVKLQCQSSQGSYSVLQVAPDGNDVLDRLIVRAALVVKGVNTSDDESTFATNYVNLLRENHNAYPGDSTDVTHSFDVENGAAKSTQISFNWDPKSMNDGSDIGGNIITYAMPHHQDLLGTAVMKDFCTPSLLGPVCLVRGSTWNLVEELPNVDFQAPRHPKAEYVPILAEALMQDIKYEIPTNFQIGAGDTYFSGKTIAKLGRILLIAEELKDLCANPSEEYASVCDGLELPSESDISIALTQLRRVVTVWVRDNQQAPFVYDTSWGGLVSCGCLYSNGECTNQMPNCPGLTDQGLNFGSGFYNDHHFHYGYHIYAAAVLAHFDESWAKDHFEDVLLLVRDYANPSTHDVAFPVFRHKDLYNGHSWANGITNPIFPNIMNQESSSEAIMSYEAVALFGKAMSTIYRKGGDEEKAIRAETMHNVGLALAATEIRSTQKYWQVVRDVEELDGIYPEAYQARVVGILWSTIIQFTTWFGNNPYLIYGIQLLPLTPISEARDKVEWAKEIYAPLAASCDQGCVSGGWSVQIFAILATIGQVEKAIQQTLDLSPSVYEGPGGNGHSKSNTLWYIATRPSVDEPYSAEDIDLVEIQELTCSQPSACTRDYLSRMAGDYSCRARIEYLMNAEDLSESVACSQVAGREFPAECGLCLPSGPIDEENISSGGNATEAIDPIIDNSLTCLQPDHCTAAVLESMAGGISCRDRIEYLMGGGDSEESACQQIAGVEFPDVCGGCIPNR
jgi:endo-1,3(4)-beta-glucanase